MLETYYCSICKSGLDENMIVICDNCDKGYHTNCHNPPINLEENAGDWFCNECATADVIENKLTMKEVMKDIDEEEKNDSQELTRI